MNTENLVPLAEEAATFLKQIASGPRLLILCQLLEGERTVGAIAEGTGMRASTVSQHLALMRAHGIVEPRRDGTSVHYSIANDAVRSVMAVLYDAFCAPAENAGTGK